MSKREWRGVSSLAPPPKHLEEQQLVTEAPTPAAATLPWTEPLVTAITPAPPRRHLLRRRCQRTLWSGEQAPDILETHGERGEKVILETEEAYALPPPSFPSHSL